MLRYKKICSNIILFFVNYIRLSKVYMYKTYLQIPNKVNNLYPTCYSKIKTLDKCINIRMWLSTYVLRLLLGN